MVITPEQAAKAVADYRAALRVANIVEQHYKANKTPDNKSAWMFAERTVGRTNQVLVDMGIG